MRRILFSLASLLVVLLFTGCDEGIKVYSPDRKICVSVDDSR